ESLYSIRQGLALEVTFSHRLTVLTGVVNVRFRGTAGDGHGETPRRNEGYKTITPTMSCSIARSIGSLKGIFAPSPPATRLRQGPPVVMAMAPAGRLPQRLTARLSAAWTCRKG